MSSADALLVGSDDDATAEAEGPAPTGRLRRTGGEGGMYGSHAAFSREGFGGSISSRFLLEVLVGAQCAERVEES